MKHKEVTGLKQNELGAIWSKYINQFDINKDTLMDKIRNVRINTGAEHDYIKKWHLTDGSAKRLYDTSNAETQWSVGGWSIAYNGLKDGGTWNSVFDEMENTLGHCEDYRI